MKRTATVVLAVSAAYVGIWALLAPHSFWAGFPGVGRWVAPLGPYDEHLVRDVGGLYLALLVVTVAALRRPELVRVVGAAWLVEGVPHLAYHLVHLDMLPTADAVGTAVALVAVVLAAAVLVLPDRWVSRSAGPPGGSTTG